MGVIDQLALEVLIELQQKHIKDLRESDEEGWKWYKKWKELKDRFREKFDDPDCQSLWYSNEIIEIMEELEKNG